MTIVTINEAAAVFNRRRAGRARFGHSRQEEHAMGGRAKQINTPSAAAQEAHAFERPHAAGRDGGAARDRRAVRAVDLTKEDIVATKASEKAPGFVHFNAEANDA
jgi:hypothetical protein